MNGAFYNSRSNHTMLVFGSSRFMPTSFALIWLCAATMWAQSDFPSPAVPLPDESRSVDAASSHENWWEDESWTDISELAESDTTIEPPSPPAVRPATTPLKPHPWQPPVPSSAPIRLPDAPEGSRSFLTHLVLENLPGDFDDTKKWGHTRERWDGLKVRMDGLKLRTKRRKKEVNHGTWKRYSISLIDPGEHLLVKITNWQQLGLGTVGFDLNLAARVNLIARRQEWNNGVRLYSVTAEAVADVQLKIGMQVSTRLDPAKFPPDVVLEPIAQSAVAELVQFKLQRISHADGPLVRELGDGLEKILRKKLVEKNEKLVGKINRQFEKKADDLRLSIGDLVKHKWLGIDPPAKDSFTKKSLTEE